MDADFWAARVQRHISAAQSAKLCNSGMMEEDDEGSDEVRAWFPCPFCYLEIDVLMLCAHLQDEHCFDLKNAVCPICAANLGKDVLGHFTAQHAHSIKRRRKSQKSSFWSNAPANMIKDLRELSNALSEQGSGNEPASDPVLFPFLCTDHSRTGIVPSTAETSDEESKASSAAGSDKERRQRAAFLQELLLSTGF